MAHESSRDVSRRRFVAGAGALGAAALAGCTQGPDDGGTGGDGTLSGDVTMTGSSTVYPLATAVANDFEENNGNVNIDISSTGSGGGFSNHFCVGNADLNNASRPISEEEQSLCSDNDVEYHEIQVATDALTVIVNAENDWVDCVTVEQLREIWSADGASTWSDVDESWPDEPINRFGAADTSGTFDYFREAVLGEEATHTSDYEATEQDNIILQGVQQDEFAIGYFGFAYYQGNQDAVKALGIDDGSGCVEPSLEAAKNGDYQPLSRPLFTYVRHDSLTEAPVAEFARYFVEQSANEDLVSGEIGYVPRTQEAMEAELEELNGVIEDVE